MDRKNKARCKNGKVIITANKKKEIATNGQQISAPPTASVDEARETELDTIANPPPVSPYHDDVIIFMFSPVEL